jgi:histidinol-phosphate/aromatic aminotransferase/cobyric acid decarboxylase-like protein
VTRAPLQPQSHGGLRPRELSGLGLTPDDVLDFSVSVNPFGPGPAVRTALESVRIDTYPDPEHWHARTRLGQACGVAPERVALGNGASELIWLLARVLTGPGRRALIVEPTFGEFRRALAATGGELIEWRAPAAGGFVPDLRAVAAAARDGRVNVAYLCAPTSPCGHRLPIAEVCELGERLRDVTLIVDQAFTSLSDAPGDLQTLPPDNVVWVRSLTKELGTPGVRIGYLLGSPALVAAIERERPSWTVSSAALAAAAAAFDDAGWLDDCRRRLRARREQMIDALRSIDCSPLPSSTFYLALPVASPASELRQRLLEDERILVRDCASFGMPRHVRVAVRDARDVQRLTKALQLHAFGRQSLPPETHARAALDGPGARR